MLTTEIAGFQIAPTAPQPPTVEPAAPPPRALVAVDALANAVVSRPATPRQAAAFALLGAGGSAYLAGVGLAISQGASLPVMLGLGAAGLTALVVTGSKLISTPRSTTVADPVEPQVHFRYAVNRELQAEMRLKHAYDFVRSATRLEASEALELFASLPRDRNWGVRKHPLSLFEKEPLTHLAILQGIGFNTWRQARWEPYDCEVVIAGLHKLGSVTPDQRARIVREALDVLESSRACQKSPEGYVSDLKAAVHELCRRAPSAGAPGATTIA